MPSLPTLALRRSARDPLFVVFLVTVLLCLLRAPDLPRLDVGAVAVGLPDVALLLLGVMVAVRLRVKQLRTLVSPPLVVAMAFAGLIVLSSIPNGTTAVTAAVKVAQLVVLTFACAALVDMEDRRDAVATIVVALAVAAATWAVVDFVQVGAGRQPSFLGEHDLAAIGTMAMSAGFAALHSPGARLGAVAWAGLSAGALAVTLGAALASLLGLYLAVGTILMLAAWRRSFKPGRALATLAVVALVTAGAVQLRSGDLGFLKSWFGPEPEQTGQYAASWSQRLIYSYIGGRIFLDNPAVGTGWYGELPPEEYAHYLPEARERFSDQPPRYFPAADADFIPQQTYDQVLYQLGIVGALLLLALLALAARQALRSALHWPRGPDSEWAYIPAAWLAALVGALAGAALFGGTPIAGIFWLTLGVAAAARTPSPPD